MTATTADNRKRQCGCQIWKYSNSKFQRQIWVFDCAELEETVTDDCDNNRQPEMATQTFWAPTFDTLDWTTFSQSFCCHFCRARHRRKSRISRWYFADAHSSRDNYFRFWRSCRYFRSLIALAIICLHFVHKPQICRWKFCVVIFSGLGGHFPLSVIIGIVQGHSPSSPWSKTLGSPLEFWRYLSHFRRYKYFRFGRPYS